MSNPDLHIVPRYRQDGKDLPEMPGLFVSDAPRRAARSRKDDILLLHLTLTGTATINTDGQDQLLENMAETYFYSSGSVTAALRVAVEDLNQFLLERNLNNASAGLQATGLLTILALHRNQLYIAQCGPNYVFTVTKDGAHQFYDPALSGRGLGLSRTPTIRFTHIHLGAGDLLLLTPQPPKAWQSPSLAQAYNRGLRTIHQVVTKPAGENFNAVIVQVHAGEGRYYVFDQKNLRDDVPAPVPKAASTGVAEPAPESAPSQEHNKPPTPTPAVAEPPQAVSSLNVPASTPALQPAPDGAPEKPPRQTGALIMTVLRAFYGALKQISYTLRAMLTRILPGNELFTIPSGMMAFVALAVPVVVVVIASTVYLRRGQAGYYEGYMVEARQTAAYASAQTEPDKLRQAWGTVMFQVAQAEAVQVTDETQALRQQAQAVLDPLDGVIRLPFANALDPSMTLGDSVNITEMVATRDSLYLFDEISGSIIRAWLTGTGYVIDEDFKCAPGPYGSATVNNIIDLVALPRGNAIEADVLALDFGGVAVYCQADDQRVFTQSLAPPDSNWGMPTAFSLDNGTLYVLDPQTNAVWVYPGEDFSYVTPPALFFGDQVPMLSNAIDLAVDLDDLYILHDNGEITTCTAGFANQQTKCNSPATFSDPRQGIGDGAVVAGASFTKILFTPPPDPSIYLFDPAQSAVYHFSLRLTFQRQFRSLEPVGSPGFPQQATAFTVSPNRTLFLAYGNQIYIANLP